MKRLDEGERRLAERLNALEPIDQDPFRERARLFQALWRHDQGYECGEYRGKLRGAGLPMLWAKDTLANYVTATSKKVVQTKRVSAA